MTPLLSPQELSFVLEAWLFAHAQPLCPKELRALTKRLLAQTPPNDALAQDAEGAPPTEPMPEDEALDAQVAEPGEDAEASTAASPAEPAEGGRTPTLGTLVREALRMLELRWQDEDDVRGVQLARIGDGYTFRTNPRYARRVRLLREERAPRLTRPALESLAIVAYRQPVTKPDVDHLRGVDSGGVMKILLERGFIHVLGKRDEPGRPLLYGTTEHFLSFFNLAHLDDLPSLRQFDELNDEAAQALRAFEGLPSLKELSEQATQLRADDGAEARDLDDVVADLNKREAATRSALLAQGVTLGSADEGAQLTH